MDSYPQQEFNVKPGWKEVGPGIHEMELNGKGDTRTYLQRFEPGARQPNSEPYTHDYYEEVYVCEGSITDLTKSLTASKGSYAFRHPGMRHGPYTSEEGVVTFVKTWPV